MKKNDIVTLQIEDLTEKGEGIGRVNGYTLFVKDAFPGDTAEAVVTKLKRTYGYARVLDVKDPSPDRVEAPCPNARRCGGCVFQEYAYEAQLKWKRRHVEETLSRIGGVTEPEVLPVIGMEHPFRYRNKAQFPVARVPGPGGGRPAAGFYAGRTHSLIEVKDCLITGERCAAVLRAVLSYMEELGLPPYDEERHLGLVRHVLIREGFSTGELLVCPVINGDGLPRPEALVSRLREIPGLKSVCVNINKKRGNVVLGDEVVPVFGDPWITDTIGGLRFRISPRSFYQVNPVQTEKLYRAAVEAAGLTGSETVYDLYCGIGTISLFAARYAKEVFGVEIVPDAVRDARENAAANGVVNARFFTGAAEELVAKGEFAPGVPCPPADVVILDPPRKGCAEQLIRAVQTMAPGRIVYVSCDPGTLARDLRRFREGDGAHYVPKMIRPVDMFPQTAHVECCCLLSKIYSNER